MEVYKMSKEMVDNNRKTEKTPNENLDSEKTNQFIRIGLIASLGLSLIMFWWIITNTILWSHGEGQNYVIIPLALSILVIPFELELLQRIPSRKFLIAQFIIGSICQMIFDYVIYNAIHNLYPNVVSFLNRDDVIGTAWLSTEIELMQLLGMWMVSTFIIQIPSIFALLKISGTPEKLKKDLHFGMIILGIFLGLRWGGTWSAPLHNLIYSLILIPLIITCLFSTNIDNIDSINIEAYKTSFLSTSAMFFIIGYWSIVIESQFSPSPSESYIWLISSFVHSIISLILYKFDFQKKIKKLLILILWIIALISTIFLILININFKFTELRIYWLIFIVVGSSVFPELLVNTYKEDLEKSKAKFLKNMLFLISGFLGIIIAYVVNIYDPLSSYIAIGFVVINFIFYIPVIKKIKI
jgi:hypothetical protein